MKNTTNENIARKKVFVSGSRTLGELPSQVQESLDSIMNQSFEILIGDSNKGIDNLVAKYVKKISVYPYVHVFSISERARFKVEDAWEFKQVELDLELTPEQNQMKLTPQQKQMKKDREMAKIADFGLSIFNPTKVNYRKNIEVSSGTLRNTIQLLKNGKKVKFFYIHNSEMKWKWLENLNDLESIICNYKEEKLSDVEITELRSARSIIDTDDLAYEKYSRIYKKYKELCKIEDSYIEKEVDESDNQLVGFVSFE